jgi:hypothetical protein
MKNFLKVLGIILLVLLVIWGVFYLLSLTGIASKLDPGLVFGQLLKGMTDALNGLQEAISGLFSNFAR